MPWQQRLNGDSLAWLLEPDAANPAIRYYALRDLLDRPADAPEVVAAQAAVMQSGPVPAILDAQEPDGYWQQPGGGYGKYRGTAWQIILLGDLGADPADERVHRACEYVLGHGIAANGGYAYNRMPVPSGVIHCLNGNVVHALIRLGRLRDPWCRVPSSGRHAPSPARRRSSTINPRRAGLVSAAPPMPSSRVPGAPPRH